MRILQWFDSIDVFFYFWFFHLEIPFRKYGEHWMHCCRTCRPSNLTRPKYCVQHTSRRHCARITKNSRAFVCYVILFSHDFEKDPHFYLVRGSSPSPQKNVFALFPAVTISIECGPIWNKRLDFLKQVHIDEFLPRIIDFVEQFKRPVRVHRVVLKLMRMTFLQWVFQFFDPNLMQFESLQNKNRFSISNCLHSVLQQVHQFSIVYKTIISTDNFSDRMINYIKWCAR